MDGVLKKIIIVVLSIVALLVVAAVAFMLLFDPNDFRAKIETEVERKTGRELVIEGDLELSLFPWLAINIGKTTLGNAPGFGDEPFLSFEQARLSVRILPMLLDRDVVIGTATLESFQLGLQVAQSGRNNWADLMQAAEAESDAVEDAGASTDSSGGLDIASIVISNASVDYVDAQVGESYRLSNFNLTSGRVGRGEPVALTSNFDFELQPADLAGDFEIEAKVLVDGDAGTVGFSDIELSVLGVDISAYVEPISYVGGAVPVMTIAVDAFSLKSLMSRLNMEPLLTADPDALGKIILDANVRVTDEAISLTDVELVVDDTTFRGSLSLAQDAVGTIGIDLAGDTINLDGYMEPVDETAMASSDAAIPVEIPADLIRSLNARGSMTFETAYLSGMTFENVKLGLNAAGGNLRMHPISAEFFDGTYQGDVRIDASADIPVLSVNENVSDVNLGALAIAMFDQESITGTINGSFQLTGRGDNLAAIQKSLSGSMSMELLEGAWEGTDIWYELRRARALYKQEPAPEPQLPARTQFSTIKVTGPVSGGVFRNDDLLAELPFMQLTGKGSVDFAAGEIDYRLAARVLEQPEFLQDVTEDELEDFTKTVIPLKISGQLVDPSISVDIEEMLKKEAEKEVKKRLLDSLFGGEDEAEEETEDQPAEEKKKKSSKDKLKDAFKDLIGG